MIIGISEKEEQIINEILSTYSDRLYFWYYGSRVKGTFEASSDLDILVQGKKEIPLDLLVEIKEKFEESRLPYPVNFSDYHKIDKAFYNRIQNELIPVGWREVKLGDVCSLISRGITPKYDKKGVFVINQRCIRGGKVSYDEARFHNNIIKRISPEKCISNRDTLVCSTGVGTLGRVGFFDKDILSETTVDSHVTIVRPSESVLFPRFLSYNLILKQAEIESLAEGTTGQTELPRTKLASIPFYLPPINEQERIAKVLGGFDDKIELLREQNKTLEAIAKAIFKSWFVDFDIVKAKEAKMPKDEVIEKYKITEEIYNLFPNSFQDSSLGPIPTSWEAKKLGDMPYGFGNLLMGVSPKSESYNNEKSGIPLLNGAADLRIDSISPQKHTTSPIRTCKKGDLLFCIRATIGNPHFADQEYCLGRGVSAFCNIKNEYKEFLWFLLNQSFSLLKSQASGSVILGLSKEDILNINVFHNLHIINAFHEVISHVFSKQFENSRQIQTLTEIRDALLPKLISGKIRV